MDMNQLITLFRLSWDLPWRTAASVLALATATGAFLDMTALQALAALSDWLTLPPSVAFALNIFHSWLTERSLMAILLASAVLLVALFYSGRRLRYGASSRAPATALIAVALAVEVGGTPIAWGLGLAVIALWLLSLIARILAVRRARGQYYPEEVFLIEEHLRRSWTGPVIAAFYVPFAPVTWMVR